MRYVFGNLSDLKNNALVISRFKGAKKQKFAGVFDCEHFKAEKYETTHALIQINGRVMHAVLAGLGEVKKASAEIIANALALAVKTAQDKKHNSIALLVDEKFFSFERPRDFGERLARAFGISTYSFNAYITNQERHVNAIEEIQFIGVPSAKQKQFQEGLAVGELIAVATNLMRDMGNHPSDVLHPEQMAEETRRMADGVPKLLVRVLNKKEIEKEKMGGLLGVNAGAARPPVFIIMEYRGGKAKDAPIALIGKGITFDSGGISLKPGDKMDEMKFDMLGAATVIAATVAVAQLKLPVNIVTLVPATENLPSATAYVPGTVLTTQSGKTIEVLNTDAEGRIILADALSYAKKFNPKCVIDAATLTGAIVSALGENRAGLWANDEKLAARIQAASEKTGELVWRMPLGEEYTEQVKSQIADVKNIGERYGSANSAAAFLQEFAPEKCPWAHLDIAGTAWSQKLQPVRRPGASGWGVALLVEFLRHA